MNYVPGDPDMLIINTPPGHAKSQTITVAYTTWRIVKDPSVRIVIVSKTSRLAEQFLLTIKNYLTHPQWADSLQRRFGPPGGFDSEAAAWRAGTIYVSSQVRDNSEKDPTVQAIGIGGQLYGARADLIILDDTVDNLNAPDYDKQINWIQTEVSTRLPDGGKIAVVGTRLAAKDLYSELRNPERYNEVGDDSEAAPWTYLSQPAVLEPADKPEDWITLWPRCDKASGKAIIPDADGYFPKWPGTVLAKRRSRMSPTAWGRVFQQQAIAEDTIFRPEDVSACVKGYQPGILQDALVGRVGGTTGLRMVAGLDPAAVGYTAAIVMGVDPHNGQRWICEASNVKGMRPEAMKAMMRDWAVKHNLSEWRVERNAFQGFLTQDSDLRSQLAALGCTLVEHTTTGVNKHDEELGVSAMEALFRNKQIYLPRPSTEAMRALIDQLCAYDPEYNRRHRTHPQKTDLIMALWFCEIRAQELIRRMKGANAFNRRSEEFHTRWEVNSRQIVPALDAEFANQPSIWG